VKISVAGHHYTVSDRARGYVDAEVGKLEKFYSPIIDAHTTITEEGKRHKVDLVVNVQAHTLKSTGEEQKVYPAIDNAVKRMTTQLKKLHDKQKGHRPELQAESSTEE
jgi:putative sigma-54 modulation protein